MREEFYGVVTETMPVVVEFWAQDSTHKGLRIARFEVIGASTYKWKGLIGEPDDKEQYKYSKYELELNGWVRME